MLRRSADEKPIFSTRVEEDNFFDFELWKTLKTFGQKYIILTMVFVEK